MLLAAISIGSPMPLNHSRGEGTEVGRRRADKKGGRRIGAARKGRKREGGARYEALVDMLGDAKCRDTYSP